MGGTLVTYLSVIVAAAAAYAFGAVWYTALAKPWMAAAGVEAGEGGRPKSGGKAYVVSLICVILVAGMMRHAFVQAGIADPAKGALSGLGLGLFVASPWIATNNVFEGRPFNLTLINGGYATIGCAIIGAILTAI